MSPAIANAIYDAVGVRLTELPITAEAVYRAPNIALARRLLGAPDPSSAESSRTDGGHQGEEWSTCPCCGGRMIIVETFEPGGQPRLWPSPAIGFDSS